MEYRKKKKRIRNIKIIRKRLFGAVKKKEKGISKYNLTNKNLEK